MKISHPIAHSALTLAAFLCLAASGQILSAQMVQGQRQGQGRMPSMQMSGTYELETERGDDWQQMAETTTRNMPQGQRDQQYHDLLGRLQAPSTIAIDRRGRTITISSSNGPETSFEADGLTHTETGYNQRRIEMRAEFVGERLMVTSRGNRSTDYVVTFEPIDNGDSLLVTRRIDNDGYSRPVTVRSYYRRVSDPRWDLYPPTNDNRRYDPRRVTVPDGTRMVAILDTPINSRNSRNGQRFTMTVQNPGEYRGARIDGVIEQVTPYGNGHNTEVRVHFDTIRLPNGQTSPFEAVLSDVRSPDGVNYNIDAASQDRNPNRGNDSVQKGAAGAAIGAIIGAIAGGGKGAAIGAVVGGAGGAILGQDRDQYLDLPRGTQVTLVVTSNRYRNP